MEHLVCRIQFFILLLYPPKSQEFSSLMIRIRAFFATTFALITALFLSPPAEAQTINSQPIEEVVADLKSKSLSQTSFEIRMMKLNISRLYEEDREGIERHPIWYDEDADVFRTRYFVDTNFTPSSGDKLDVFKSLGFMTAMRINETVLGGSGTVGETEKTADALVVKFVGLRRNRIEDEINLRLVGLYQNAEASVVDREIEDGNLDDVSWPSP